MAFWSQPGGTEPLRQYRWYISFGGFGNLDSVKYALKKVDKPKAKINSIQHKYLNHFFNYPGRLEWEDINLTFAAVSGESVTGLLNLITINSGYTYPRDGNTGQTISKDGFVGQVGRSLDIIQIDAGGNTIPGETWRLTNAFFTSIQYGTLDYSNEEIVEISCTVKYDTAALV